MYAKYEAKNVKPEIINQKSKDDQHMVMVPKCNKKKILHYFST